jgi:hypothetical protein
VPEGKLKERAWIEQSLARQGIKITGEISETHVRPWSAVLHVPTSCGDAYFKAVGSAFAFEPLLTEALYRLRPDCILKVFAVDAERGWMLMADGGRTLRMAFKKGLDRSTWNEVLTLYAGLQIDLASHVDELLAMGVRDRRTVELPALYQELLEEKEWLMIDQPDGLTTAEYEDLLNAVPQVEAMCRQLTAYAVPDSLHHNDLHDANVFYNNGHIKFFDWGDSSIAHPFFSLRTAFVIIEYIFDLVEDDPIFDEFAMAYLRPFAKFESEENLWAAYQLAHRLWSLSSAVKYKTQLLHIEGMRAEYAMAVPGLLQEFLKANQQVR